MKKATLFMLLVSTVLLPSISFADIKGDFAARLPLGQIIGNALSSDPSDGNIKGSIKEIIERGGDVNKTVEMAINSGYDPQAIICGAISASGSLKDIIAGALAAGLSSDRVAADCKSCGADPDSVASIIASLSSGEAVYGDSGANYGSTITPILSSIPSGGGGGGGKDVSPSK